MSIRVRQVVCVAAVWAASGAAQAADSVGLMVMGAPKYEGATDYRMVPLPVVNVERGPFFVSSNHTLLPAAGVQFGDSGDGVHVGAFVSGALGRKDDATHRVEGLGDIRTSAQLGVFANWVNGPLLVEGGYQHALHTSYGGQAYLKAVGSFTLTPRDRLQLSTALDWADHDYMQTWFGVTPEQSRNSVAGLPPYEASAGLKDVTFAAGVQHAFSAHWVGLTLVGVKGLVSSASDSPLNEKRVSVFGGVGVMYRF